MRFTYLCKIFRDKFDQVANLRDVLSSPELIVTKYFIIKSMIQVGKEKEAKKKVDPSEPQSELLTADLQNRAFSSVSRAFGEQILTDSLGARHSSMVLGID